MTSVKTPDQQVADAISCLGTDTTTFSFVIGKDGKPAPQDEVAKQVAEHLDLAGNPRSGSIMGAFAFAAVDAGYSFTAPSPSNGHTFSFQKRATL